jgi:hypothetical protein
MTDPAIPTRTDHQDEQLLALGLERDPGSSLYSHLASLSDDTSADTLMSLLFASQNASVTQASERSFADMVFDAAMSTTAADVTTIAEQISASLDSSLGLDLDASMEEHIESREDCKSPHGRLSLPLAPWSPSFPPFCFERNFFR